MATTEDCYYFDYLFYVRNPRGEVIGVCTLTQADSREYGTAARNGALAYARTQSKATGLRFEMKAAGKAGSIDKTVEAAIAKYGAL